MREMTPQEGPQEREQPADIARPISVVVKLRDSVEFPHDGSLSKVVFQPLFTALTSDEIDRLVARARQLDPAYKPPNFRTYFRGSSKPEAEPLTVEEATYLVKEMRRSAAVEWAYINPSFSDPTVNVPPNPKSADQGYLNPAPEGIDTQYVWTNNVPGGDGSLPPGAGPDLKVIDVERGWNLKHDDLPKNINLLSGLIENNALYHGTAVLGIICATDALDNVGKKFGCIGIVPNLAAPVEVISYTPTNGTDPNIANDILTAIKNLSFGDVLVLETQADKPVNPVLQHLPVELIDPGIIFNNPAIYENIRLATALGIVVVEAAANGMDDQRGGLVGVDLDQFPQLDRKSAKAGANPKFQDSGAIIVGGAKSSTLAAADGSKRHEKRPESNFGSRIDCYAWGENVMTTASNAAGATNLYTGDIDPGMVRLPLFDGTSAATAIVAGAALSVQGMAQAKGFRLSPPQLRAILSDSTPPPTPSGPLTNTPSLDPINLPIGVMPNLAWIHQNALPSAPDLYIRDFLGDVGDPHTGAISASPDIIVRDSKAVDATAAYGTGSGNENSDTLGSEVKAGQDNFIYVRVLNRGPAAAVDVTATVYWSPVATLVTPNLWTLVGSVKIPIVPPNMLTVSDAIGWPAAMIPAPGHYCFVGLIGNAADPAPNPAAFQDWANYQSFIRNNNNVTWRNFNVMNTPIRQIGAEKYAVLEFIAPGVPTEEARTWVERVLKWITPGKEGTARQMQLDIVAHLPDSARIFLEGPADFLDLFDPALPSAQEDGIPKLRMVRVSPQGRFAMGRALFPANSRTALRLLVHIPDDLRDRDYQLHVSQIFGGLEVGRVTWRLTAPRKEMPNS